ncbi:A24 family peptidase [Paenibacillus thalictri]|uniref:A24 family peptidase n=1 Tax=Paenibacillus thalictri TaxID=2527873 RepID=UPI0013EEEAE6|nr:A24 family peptidase [Paenibacillus thalictri]
MVYTVLFAFLTGACFTDLRRNVIPNWLTMSGAAAGLSLHLLLHGWEGLVYAACGLAAGFGCLLVLYMLKALGAGDVKLFAAIGAIAGTEFVLSCLVYSILYAGVSGLLLFMWRRQIIETWRESLLLLFNIRTERIGKAWEEYAASDNRIRFPFMIAVAPGALTAAFFWIP